jgi:hypothetical protein
MKYETVKTTGVQKQPGNCEAALAAAAWPFLNLARSGLPLVSGRVALMPAATLSRFAQIGSTPALVKNIIHS